MRGKNQSLIKYQTSLSRLSNDKLLFLKINYTIKKNNIDLILKAYWWILTVSLLSVYTSTLHAFINNGNLSSAANVFLIGSTLLLVFPLLIIQFFKNQLVKKILLTTELLERRSNN